MQPLLCAGIHSRARYPDGIEAMACMCAMRKHLGGIVVVHMRKHLGGIVVVHVSHADSKWVQHINGTRHHLWKACKHTRYVVTFSQRQQLSDVLFALNSLLLDLYGLQRHYGKYAIG